MQNKNNLDNSTKNIKPDEFMKQPKKSFICIY